MSQHIGIGIGKYRKRDYQEILRLSEDRESMDQTWSEWKANKNRALKNFQKMGLKVLDVVILPIELVTYCRVNGMRINGESRSKFVSYKFGELNKR